MQQTKIDKIAMAEYFFIGSRCIYWMGCFLSGFAHLSWKLVLYFHRPNLALLLRYLNC